MDLCTINGLQGRQEKNFKAQGQKEKNKCSATQVLLTAILRSGLRCM
jgi:hypothetical protein